MLEKISFNGINTGFSAEVAVTLFLQERKGKGERGADFISLLSALTDHFYVPV